MMWALERADPLVLCAELEVPDAEERDALHRVLARAVGVPPERAVALSAPAAERSNVTVRGTPYVPPYKLWDRTL